MKRNRNADTIGQKKCPATYFAIRSSSEESMQSNADALPGARHSLFHLCSDKPALEWLHNLL